MEKEFLEAERIGPHSHYRQALPETQPWLWGQSLYLISCLLSKYILIDMVSILTFTLNLTVGEYRRSILIDMVSTLHSDVAIVM